MFKRSLLALILFATPALADPNAIPANEVMASPSGSAGPLSPRALTAADMPFVFPLSIANGGTGTATPGLVAGTNVTITGSWPNQTINSSGGTSLIGGTTTVTGTCPTGQLLFNNAGVLGCQASAGGGNVSNSGSPTTGQIGVWVDATHVQGVTNLVVPGTFTAILAASSLGQVKAGSEASSDYICVYGYACTSSITSAADPGQAGTFAARTLNASGGSTIGNVEWGFNDRTASAVSAWAGYAEARRYNTVVGGTIVREQDITDFSNTTPIFDNYANTYGPSSGGGTQNLWLASGGGCTTAAPCYDPVLGTTTAVAKTAGLALGVIANGDGSGTGADYKRAINFGYNAIHGVDGKTPGQYGPVISMAMGQTIQWEGCTNTASYPSSCAVGNTVGEMSSQATSTTNHARLIFVNGAWQVVNTAGGVELQVNTAATDTAGIATTGSSTGFPIVGPVGAATNINLFLTGKGAGFVQLGSPLVLPIFTVGSLFACNGSTKGAYAAVSDANSPSYNGTLTGGGAVSIPVYCNGTAWTAH